MRIFFNVTMIMSFLALGAISLSGCNTVQGAGRDIQRGGEVMQDAAR